MSTIARRTKSNQRYMTPWWLFLRLAERWAFTLDAAADHDNALLSHYMTPGQNALRLYWDPVTFCNPPYADIAPWLDWAVFQARERNVTSVFLVPATLETNWYRDYHIHARSEIIAPRVSFYESRDVRCDGAPAASQLMIFDAETVSNPTPENQPRISLVRYEKPKVVPPDGRWAYRGAK